VTTLVTLGHAAGDQHLAGLVGRDRDRAERQAAVPVRHEDRGAVAAVVERRERQARDLRPVLAADGDRRRHAELDLRPGVGQREAGEKGAGGGVGRRGQLPQGRLVAPARIRPQGHAGPAAPRLPDQGFGNGDGRLLLAGPGDADRRLVGGDDLARLDARPGDHPVRVGGEHRVGQGVLGERQRPLRPHEAAAGLLRRRLLPLQVRRRRPALPHERLDALQLGLSLRQRGGRRRLLGLGPFALETQVDLVERGERLPGLHGVPDADQPTRHLAGNAKGEVALHPRPDRADEAALADPRLEAHALDEDRALGLRGRDLLLVLARREQDGGEGCEADDAERRDADHRLSSRFWPGGGGAGPAAASSREGAQRDGRGQPPARLPQWLW
jgi:hypothetical protein